jgi:iron complex transport system ATP-binding protein
MLEGRAIGALSHRARAQRIGFLPQVPEIAWAVDVETLVGLGRTPFVGARGLGADDRAATAEAMAATDVASLSGRIVETLSGGERARVLIARVLAGRPDWILADEPMAGLDPRHALDTADLLRRLAHEEGRGVILTLHDLSLALRMADTVVVLAEGQVIATGAPLQVLTRDVLIRAYGVETTLIEGAGGPLLEIVGRSDL